MGPAQDPIGLAGGVNLYAYAGNNPVSFWDPFGLQPDTLKYDGSKVTLIGDDGTVKFVGEATSGRPGMTAAGQGLKDEGPIPEGTYTLNPGEISNVEGLMYIRRRIGSLEQPGWRDWGHYRAPLHPADGTNTRGRSGFFLHGGVSPGSAGCIDVGKSERSLFPMLQSHSGPVTVVVKYPSFSTVTTPARRRDSGQF